MIIATGIDIIEVQRLVKSIERYGKAFLDRVYTPVEQERAPASGPARNTYFAGRWAVKEAVAKALGTGIGEHCAMTDVEVTNDDQGRPKLTLLGNAKKTADELGIATIHISISHEKLFAVAHAIAEA